MKNAPQVSGHRHRHHRMNGAWRPPAHLAFFKVTFPAKIHNSDARGRVRGYSCRQRWGVGGSNPRRRRQTLGKRRKQTPRTTSYILSSMYKNPSGTSSGALGRRDFGSSRFMIPGCAPSSSRCSTMRADPAG
eukprot:2587951-Prymnesium_polylepis.1